MKMLEADYKAVFEIAISIYQKAWQNVRIYLEEHVCSYYDDECEEEIKDYVEGDRGDDA